MSTRPYTRSFAGGEVTPELFGRVDLSKTQIALKTCRNFIVKPQGPVENRPGFQYVNEVKFSFDPTRVIEYAIDATTTMCLEFGNNYIRFHRNGAPVVEASKTILGVTNASPGVFNVAAHGYATDDWIQVLSTWSATISYRYLKVVVVDANHFSLTTLDGVAIDTTSFGAFTFGAVARIYELATPYGFGSLFDIHYAQSGSVMTLVHTTYAPRELTRITDTNWTLTTPTFASTVSPPTSPVATPNGAGGFGYYYVITSVAPDIVDESVASAVCTCNNDLSLAGHYNDITWVAAAGVTRYNVYKVSNGIYGFIGQAEGTTFRDDNILPDTSQSPPIISNPFNAAGDYPGAVTYFEQRRIFGGSINRPQNIWMTKAGTESNLAYSIPTRDDDSIRAKVYSRLGSTIRHLMPLSDLLILTSGVEFRMTAQNSDTVTPSSISFKPDSYEGSNNVQPVTAGSAVIYPQARGGRVRELSFNWQSSGYKSNELSILAPHLFDGYSIVDMAYSKAPTKIVWAVRSDGLLLGVTYTPEQEVAAWHHHDTDGDFESICNAAEGVDDCQYAVIQRTINGRQVRAIERSTSRRADQFFVDMGVRRVSTGLTATITGLWHLEAKTVSVLVNGGVHPTRVVTNGSITLEAIPPINQIVDIGIGYTCDLETMPLVLALQDGSYGQGAYRNINKVFVRMVNSSGLFAGPSFDKLRELKQRSSEPMGSPPAILNGIHEISTTASWNYDASLCIRQSNPLPLTITSMTIDVALGG